MANKQNNLRARVRRKIDMLFIVMFDLLAIGCCILTITTYNNEHVKTVNASLENCSKELQTWLDTKTTQVKDIVSDIEIDRKYNNNKGCQEFLAQCISTDNEVFDYYIGYENGTAVFGGGWEPAPGEYDASTREWYKQAVATDGVIITEPYTDAEQNVRL